MRPRITGFLRCIYVFGCKLSLVRLCDCDFVITPVDDITIGITCAVFCFHTAHISFASSWYLFCLSVIVLVRLCLFGTAVSIKKVFFVFFSYSIIIIIIDLLTLNLQDFRNRCHHYITLTLLWYHGVYVTPVLFDLLFFKTVTNTDIAFYVFLRKDFLTTSHTSARFCVFPFIFYLCLFPLGHKRTPLYLPCSTDNCLQNAQNAVCVSASVYSKVPKTKSCQFVDI